MPDIVEVAALSTLPDGGMRAVFPKGLPVLLARAGGEVFAVENRCAHMGCPLSGGKLRGRVLTCPCHDWRFDVGSGKFLDAPELSLRSYTVLVRDEKIFLEV